MTTNGDKFSQFSVRWEGGNVAEAVFNTYLTADAWGALVAQETEERTGVKLKYDVVSRIVTRTTTDWAKH